MCNSDPIRKMEIEVQSRIDHCDLPVQDLFELYNSLDEVERKTFVLVLLHRLVVHEKRKST